MINYNVVVTSVSVADEDGDRRRGSRRSWREVKIVNGNANKTGDAALQTGGEVSSTKSCRLMELKS